MSTLDYNFLAYTKEWSVIHPDAPRLKVKPGSLLAGSGAVTHGLLARPHLVEGYVYSTEVLHELVTHRIGLLAHAIRRTELGGSNNVIVIGRGLGHSDQEKFVWTGNPEEFAANWELDKTEGRQQWPD